LFLVLRIGAGSCFYAGPAGNGIILIDAAIKREEGYLMPGGTEWHPDVLNGRACILTGKFSSSKGKE
jgi:hypothetical protein